MNSQTSFNLLLANNVVEYWFADASQGIEQCEQRNRFWFQGNADVDYDIERRYGKLIAAARQGLCDHWLQDNFGALALIVLLDQMPRNIHRGSAQAFASDAMAQSFCTQMIDSERYRQLHPVYQTILLMPLEHAENMELQELSVQHFQQLAAEHKNTEWQKLFDGYVSFAIQHRDIIQQFGRFPYRNAVLGRADTEAEQDYLKTGQRFGQ